MILLILTTPPYYSCAKPTLLRSFHPDFVSGFDKKKLKTLGGALLSTSLSRGPENLLFFNSLFLVLDMVLILQCKLKSLAIG